MTKAVVVAAARTAIATSRKGTLVDTPGEVLATHIVNEIVQRSGLRPEQFDDVLLGESLYGGGDLARYAAVAAGLQNVGGVALNRHCASSLASVGFAAGSIIAGMDRAVIAGGVQAGSLNPINSWRIPGTDDKYEQRMAPTFPHTADANDDVSISVGWNLAQKYNISREELDAWAYRSHMRAVAGIDNGSFVDEITPIKVTKRDGSVVEFAVDEHPRRTSTLEKLASLPPLHPEIEGFSITAGNASGGNDAAAALALVADDLAAAEGLEGLATIEGWAAAGVDPRFTGDGAIAAAQKLLARTGLKASDIALWEINEAWSSVPIAAVKVMDLDDEKVNILGSGCSLGHPVAASGARMLTTLTYELRRRGGGLGIATMCAGGGQGGAVLIRV